MARLTLLLFLTLLCLPGRPALAQHAYTLTDLGPALTVRALNDAGRAVGSLFLDGVEGPGVFTDTGPQLVTRDGQANAISGNIVVGFAADGPINMEAFAAHPLFGVFRLGLLPGGAASAATGINRRLTVVGYGDTPTSNFTPTLFAFGKVFALPLLNGGDGHATAVSPHGRIVGDADVSPEPLAPFHAVLWWAGKVKDLGTLGGPFSSALAVNDQPLVVGWADSPTGRVAMTWTPKDGMQALPAVPDFPFCQALSVNARGVIVGRCDPAGFEPTSRAVRWGQDRRVVELRALVDAPGWTFLEAAGINERGQIAGIGLLSGVPHGFVLTPEPERVARR